MGPSTSPSKATAAAPVVDTVAVDPPAPAAPAAPPAPSSAADPPVVKRFPAGSKVTIKGLTGGVKLQLLGQIFAAAKSD